MGGQAQVGEGDAFDARLVRRTLRAVEVQVDAVGPQRQRGRAALADAAEGADVAVLHGGAVRGNRVYESGLITFGDLQSECPFQSACVVATLDGATLSDMVRRSRTPWSCGNLNAMALHLDDHVCVDAVTHEVVTVAGEPLNPARLYTVVSASKLERGREDRAAGLKSTHATCASSAQIAPALTRMHMHMYMYMCMNMTTCACVARQGRPPATRKSPVS